MARGDGLLRPQIRTHHAPHEGRKNGIEQQIEGKRAEVRSDCVRGKEMFFRERKGRE